MRRILGCFIILMIMMTSQIFAGTDYYVDGTNGNDSNSGTSPSNAWKTVRKLNSTYFNPGDTIKFKKGETWREKLTVPSSGSSGNPITFTSYGSGNDPKILRSIAKNSTGDWTDEGVNLWYAISVTDIINLIYNSEASEATMVAGKGDLNTQGEAWYDDPNSRIYVYSTSNPATAYSGSIEIALLDNAINVNDKAYITVDGIDIRYVGNDAIRATFVATGSNLIVQNCNFKFIGSNLSGDTHTYGRSIRATIYNNSNFSDNTFEYTWTAVNCRSNGSAWVVTIDGNTVSHQHGDDGNTDAISFGGVHSDYDGSVVSNNDVSGFRDDGIDLYYAHNVIVRNNTVHDIAAGTTGNGNGIKGGGISGATHSLGNQILRNLIYNINVGAMKAAIHVNGCENILIAYNIAYGCDKGYADGSLQVSGAYDNPQIYNNVFFDMAKYGILMNGGIDTDNRKTATIKNNICDGDVYYDISVGACVTVTGGNNCLMNNSNASVNANSTYSGTDLGTTDPLFVDASNNDFRLKPSSLCIDAGTYVGLTEDYAGNTVPYGWVVDIGAYEYTGINPLYANISASPTLGYVPLTVNFTGGATGGVLPYSYSWDFGDGTSSSEQIQSHTYSQAGVYTVTLTVTDSESNQDEDSLTIDVRAVITPLEASCAASPTSGEVPLTVNFTGSATGGVLPYSYSWDFGDGTSSSEQNPIHTYSQAGDYTVTLTVTDNQSNQDNDSLTINASAVIITPLKASFIASPVSGEVPLPVNFTGNATGGVLPYSYSWDFGDGTTSSEQNPSHIYSQAGDYTAYFTVTDSESDQDNDSLSINASAATNSAYLSCSPTSLYFGATTSGNETTDQYLRIINAGSGSLTWNIEDDADWLFCSPSSGTDRGEITVSVNSSGLPLGLYVATITVSSPEAYNSPQYVSVNLRVYEPEQESPPFGSLDTPVDGSTVSGSIPVTGWALDDIEVVRLEIKRNSDPVDPPEAIGPDGLVYIGDAVFVEGARPDVEKSYADYPLNSRAGWGYMLLTNDLPYRGNGSFTIYTFAYDVSGHREEIGRKTILCDNINRVKPFGTIDTPEQGEIIGGSDYVIFGWALTPLPKTIPKDGSTIWVWVDGVQVGHPVFDQYREDIATLYPEYNNAQGAVGYYYLDTTQYENGMHTIAWSVMDDEGEADEIGARYFFIDNIETASVHNVSFGLRSIYREDAEGRLRVGIKEVGREYRPQVDDDREIDTKSILNIQIEEMEPLRIVLEESSGGNMKYIGWGENKSKALPIGSTLDREKGIFSWIPTPGFIGSYVFHFAVTDGSYMSKPIQVVVDVIPKSYDWQKNKVNYYRTTSERQGGKFITSSLRW